MAAWLGLIYSFIEAAKAFFIWRSKEIEIASRRLLLDEQIKIEKEIDEIEAEIEKIYKNYRENGGSLDAAIRLRDRVAQRTEYSTYISATLLQIKGRSGNSN